MSRGVSAILLAGLIAIVASAGEPHYGRPFQPGIRLDWDARLVIADAVVVLREGPLEFFACFPGKEHESILRLLCDPQHLYMALGLMGHEPGRPPRWDTPAAAYEPAEGDLLEIHVLDRHPGLSVSARAESWMRRTEDGGRPLPMVWRFAGSRRGADGRLLAAVTGSGVSVVDMDDALLSLPESRSGDNAEIWLECGPDVPPLEVAVELIFRAAVPLRHTFAMDALGVTRIDDTPVRSNEFLGRLALAIEQGERASVRVARDALRSDVARLRSILHESAGLVGVELLEVDP